ncbi:MAG: hypothetical protein ACPL3P_04340 [Anaerolineales bacterium]
MRTPAGKECPYFYGDYYRGRNNEECRLLQDANPALPWKAALCQTCPVPSIRQANACPDMQLIPSLARSFPFLKQEVHIRAYCIKSHQDVPEPHVGCGICHPLNFIESGENDETNPAT